MKSIACFLTVCFCAELFGYSWDGKPWADNSAFLSPITSDVKDNCRKILAVGEAKGYFKGRMGQIGDSITNSMAYFNGVVCGGVKQNETGHNYDPIRNWLADGKADYNCWYHTNPGSGKGPAHCNNSGWTVKDAVASGHPQKIVESDKFSWCLIMYGTNDIDKWTDNVKSAESWKAEYKAFVQGFIDLGVVPVVSAIPPEKAHVEDGRVEIANGVIKSIADELKIPYVDYYGMIIKHQPTPEQWHGGLIHEDGTHPSNGGQGSNDFSQDGQTKTAGYAARTRLTLDMAEKVREIIFDNGAAEKGGSGSGASASAADGAFPDGVFMEDYTASFPVAVEGVEPHKFSASGLPSGLKMNPETGAVSGKPKRSGAFEVKVTVTDSGKPKMTKKWVLNLSINKPAE